jgi:hypothetical protein
VVLEGCALVLEPVALFGGQIAAPVRDLEVALKERRVGERLGKFVAYADGLLGAGGNVIVRSISKSRALFLRVCLILRI